MNISYTNQKSFGIGMNRPNYDEIETRFGPKIRMAVEDVCTCDLIEDWGTSDMRGDFFVSKHGLGVAASRNYTPKHGGFIAKTQGKVTASGISFLFRDRPLKPQESYADACYRILKSAIKKCLDSPENITLESVMKVDSDMELEKVAKKAALEVSLKSPIRTLRMITNSIK